MATNVYSRVFVSQSGLTGDADYVVPAGYVAIITALDWYTGAHTPAAKLRLEDVGTSGSFFYDPGAIDGLPYYGKWRGKQVFEAGTTVRVHVDNNPADVRLSGDLLTAT
jgi:hypothetical protein